jgi:SAM-dependent methyltransferase
VAVLGSTPEYLDLVTQWGAREIYCLEASSAFHAAMEPLRRYPGSETVVEGDWLETLPSWRGVFDLILSDFTLGNVEYDEQPRLLSLIADSLTPDGRLIDRILTYRRPCYRYRDLARRFRSRPANLVTLNDFNAMWLFCGERVHAEQVVDASATYSWAARNYPQAEIGWLVDNCARLSPRGSRWYYGKEWGVISRWYRQHLDIIAETPEPRLSAYYGWAFILESRRRLQRVAR